MSAPVETLVQRLNARRSGKGWKAKCPAHDDQTPSLSISEGTDGRALLKCHAGCSTDNVLNALGMAQRDLFPATSPRPAETRTDTFIAPNCVDVDGSIELQPTPAAYTSPPVTLLPASLQEYIRVAAKALNVDVAYVLLPTLSALASAIGNSRSIELKPGFIQPPIIWTGIIGRSGSRKSPALEAGCFAVMEHERELARQNKADATAYEEELAKWEGKKRDQRGLKPEPPDSLTCLMDDLTLAALAEAIEVNPHGVLVRKDELSQWFASFDQFTNARGADVASWLSLHTGVMFGLDRKTDHRRFRLWHPRVSITGGIQPAVLSRVLTRDLFERGLPARFLLAAPPATPDKWSEATIPDRDRNAVLKLFGELYLLQPELENGETRPILLTLDADAKAAYVAYYNECGTAASESDEPGEAAWSKLSGYAARLALVGQLARNPSAENVTGEVMSEACGLARWFGREAERIYATLTETPEQREQRKLVEFIQGRGGAVTVREIMQSYWPLRNDKEKAEQQLAALVKKGRGEWVEVHPVGRGRPTKKFQLLQASTSTKIPNSRGETANCVDVDEPSSKLVFPGGMVKRTANDGWPPSERCKCGSCRRDLAGAPSYWQRWNNPRLVRCKECQEIKWILGGFDVVCGFPYGDRQATIAGRIAEDRKNTQEKLERLEKRLLGQKWINERTPMPPVRVLEEARFLFNAGKVTSATQMTPGQFLAEAGTLFNATPAKA